MTCDRAVWGQGIPWPLFHTAVSTSTRRSTWTRVMCAQFRPRFQGAIVMICLALALLTIILSHLLLSQSCVEFVADPSVRDRRNRKN